MSILLALKQKGFLFLIIAFLIVPKLCSYSLSNYGAMILVHHSESLLNKGWLLPDIFNYANLLYSDNISASRGLGHYYWLLGNDSFAFKVWQKNNFTVSDYLAFGQLTTDTDERWRWYTLAWQTDPENPYLWLYIGLLCRYDNIQNQLCSLFLEYNNSNYLVDSELAFGRSAWHFNRREKVDYQIVNCPNFPEKKCTQVVIPAMESLIQSSWLQCHYLSTTEIYHYSVWVKADVADLGQWRPLYFQGTANGLPHGIGEPIQEGSTEWVYWERSIELTDFDHGRVCFHPVVLLSEGQVWFHTPSLRLIKK